MENFSEVYGFHGLNGFHGFIGLLVSGFHELIALISGYIARISGPFKIKQILLKIWETRTAGGVFYYSEPPKQFPY